MRKFRIQRVRPDQVDDIIEHRVPLGLFLTKEGGRWVAVDNRDGDAWTEDFREKIQAICWLLDEFEQDIRKNDADCQQEGNENW